MRSFLFLFIVVLAIPAWSQKYRPAYIVNNNGDTTRGYAINRSLRKGYDRIDFKSTLEGQATRHTPADISAFGAPDVLFRSRMIGEPGKPQERQFARIYMDGMVSLFGSRDNKLWITADTTSGSFPIKNRNYLVYYSKSCPALTDRAGEVKLDRDNLVEFVTDIYDCKGNTDYEVFLAPLKPYLFNYYVNAGYGISDLTYRGYSKDVENTEFAASASPVGGVSMEMYLRERNQRRFSFDISLFMYHAFFLAIYIDQREPSYRFESLEHEYIALQFPVAVKYDFVSRRDLRVSAGVGMMSSILLGDKATLNRDQATSAGILTEQIDVSPLFNPGLLEVIGVLGVKKVVHDRSFVVELRPTHSIQGAYAIRGISLVAFIPLNRNTAP